MSSISKYDTVYFFLEVSGGTPGESIRLKFVYNWPGYPSDSGTTPSMKEGDEYYHSTLLYYPAYESGGTFNVRVYNANTNQLLTSGSVNIR
jgi:hypothetical protein